MLPASAPSRRSAASRVLISGGLALCTYWFPAPASGQGEILGWGREVVLSHEDLSDLIATAPGSYHSLAVKADGSLVAWGYNSKSQSTVPTPNTGFVSVAAGAEHSLALKADGSIVAWGLNSSGQCNIPSPNSSFVAVAASANHSLALRDDGSIAAWGYV